MVYNQSQTPPVSLSNPSKPGRRRAPGTVDLSWNSPYALSGDAAGGDFQIERINELTGDWDLITTIPDGILVDPTPTILDLVHKC